MDPVLLAAGGFLGSERTPGFAPYDFAFIQIVY